MRWIADCHEALFATIGVPSGGYKAGSALHLGGWETATDPIPGAGQVADPAPPGPIADPDILYRQASMQTLRGVAETLISAPQRRKALIYISPGVGIDVAASAIPVSSTALTGPGVAMRDGDPKAYASRMSLIDANRQLAQDLTQLFLRMQRANVTIYPVDPCGAGGFQRYVAQQMRVPRSEHHTHTAFAEWRCDFVWSDACAWSERHVRRDYTLSRMSTFSKHRIGTGSV